MTEWRQILMIINTYGDTLGLCMNKKKSMLIYALGDQTQIPEIASIFSVNVFDIEHGFRYLGFTLKPNWYKVMDWEWLI